MKKTESCPVPIPAEYIPHVARILRAAYRYSKTTDVMPAAMVFYRKDGELGCDVIGTVFHGDSLEDVAHSKDGYAEWVKQTASRKQAEAVIMLSESWTLPHCTPEEYAEHKRKYKQIADNPKRRECIWMVLETYDGQWTGVAMLRGKTPNRFCRPPNWIAATGDGSNSALEGRFAKFLPPKYATPAQFDAFLIKLRDEFARNGINPDRKFKSGETLITTADRALRARVTADRLTDDMVKQTVQGILQLARIMGEDLK